MEGVSSPAGWTPRPVPLSQLALGVAKERLFMSVKAPSDVETDSVGTILRNPNNNNPNNGKQPLLVFQDC